MERATALAVHINGMARRRRKVGAMKHNFRRFPKIREQLLKSCVANVELLRLFQSWALLSKCQI